MLMTTSADRDWSDLPVKTVFLPLIQSLTQYLAGGKRGNLDGGIAVGAAKELSFPANFVGSNLRVTKPDKQNTEVAIAGEKDRATATVEENDQAGIYRLSLPAGGDKDSGAPQLYAVNAPFLESRLDEISAAELAGEVETDPHRSARRRRAQRRRQTRRPGASVAGTADCNVAVRRLAGAAILKMQWRIENGKWKIPDRRFRIYSIIHFHIITF